jgi:hypothetical protein
MCTAATDVRVLMKRSMIVGRPEPSEPALAPAGQPAPDPAGRVFRWLTVLPALLAASWLLVGLPLLLAGWFRPLLMLALAVPVAVLSGLVAWRLMPGSRAGPATAGGQSATAGGQSATAGGQSATAGGQSATAGGQSARTPWWPVPAVLAVAGAFGIDQFAYRSQQIIVGRDPGSYLQFGNWIARHGSLPIPDDLAAFGAPFRLLSFFSSAFDPVGHSLAPQFMAGEPMAVAAGFWAGGVGAAVAVNAVIGAGGILVTGGLAGRLAGPRWAPLAALALAVTLPEQYTSRSAFSEPLAQVLFLGGLCLVVDSLGQDGAAARWLAILAGLAIGLTLVVRIDGISDLLPLIPYCGLLFLQRRPQAVPLVVATAVGVAYGVVDGLVLTRPYLKMEEGSLVPVVLIGFALAAGTALVLIVRWDRGLAAPGGIWPAVAAAAPVIIAAGLFLRPYVQTVHGPAGSSTASTITAFQRADHLPIQPTRLYYEISLHWVFWYAGGPAVVLATIGAAVLARRCLQGRAPDWTLPLLCLGWVITSVLLRPGIVPDQPWASRRLVPGVLPGFVVLAVWAVAWVTDRLRGQDALLRGAAAAVLSVALVMPGAQTSFGFGVRRGGPLGVRVIAAGPDMRLTYQGEIRAVRQLCAALPARGSVLLLGNPTVGQLEEVVRGMCGLPSASLALPHHRGLPQVLRDIRRTGRQPVLLAASRADLAGLGGTPRQIMDLKSRSDEHTLTTPPTTTSALSITVWMVLPAA